MKTVNTSKNLKEMPYPHKEKLWKRKGKIITQTKTNAPISKTSSECLKLTIQTYQMRRKNLKWSLDNFTFSGKKMFISWKTYEGLKIRVN